MRVVSELGIVLLSYPNLLMVEVRWERVGYFLPGSLMVTPINNPHALHNHPPFPPFPTPISTIQVVRLESAIEGEPREYIDLARYAHLIL